MQNITKPKEFSDMFKHVPDMEIPSPILGKIEGTIPSWIRGSLIRNGPGKINFGDTYYNHLFDGSAMLKRFHIKDGKVSFQSSFIRTDNFKKNSAANRIVCSEFGTVAFPDPCKSLFQRFLTYFYPDKEPSDNTNVNVFPIHDELYAATETALLHRIDPETLDSAEQVKITKYVSMLTGTAHPHTDPDGTFHNIGYSKGSRGANYAIFRVPPPEQGQRALSKACIAAEVPFQFRFSLCYYHSFAMTENYYIFLEQPYCLNFLKLELYKKLGWPFSDCLTWYDNIPTKFHVIDKKTGKKMNEKFNYITEKLLVFHHINAYEENGQIIVDVSGLDSGVVVSEAKVHNRNEKDRQEETLSTMRRYVLPLDIEKVDENTNLVKIPNCSAKAKLVGSNIVCEYEALSKTRGELPQVNYQRVNGRKYRYMYYLGCLPKTGPEARYSIEKIDFEKKENTRWFEEGCYPGEPVFVQSPNAVDEDDGVILDVVHDYRDLESGRIAFLLVLDAKTMKELGRANFDMLVNADFHGFFSNKF